MTLADVKSIKSGGHDSDTKSGKKSNFSKRQKSNKQLMTLETIKESIRLMNPSMPAEQKRKFFYKGTN